jgi:S-adenosylmethionine synthetase
MVLHICTRIQEEKFWTWLQPPHNETNSLWMLKFSVENKQKLPSITHNYFPSLNFKFIFIMAYLFTSESVEWRTSRQNCADQILDALIDNFLAFDANSKVACETLVTTGQVILAGK